MTDDVSIEGVLNQVQTTVYFSIDKNTPFECERRRPLVFLLLVKSTYCCETCQKTLTQFRGVGGGGRCTPIQKRRGCSSYLKNPIVMVSRKVFNHKRFTAEAFVILSRENDKR